MVDLKPKRGRVDAIQSFASQETPIARITNAHGRPALAIDVGWFRKSRSRR
jgi:hypothetical protein